MGEIFQRQLISDFSGSDLVLLLISDSAQVSGVAFDSYWSTPNTDGNRFGSVGQDTQLLLWDLEMNEIVVPLRRAPGGSLTFSTGSQSAHWDKHARRPNALPFGVQFLWLLESPLVDSGKCLFKYFC